MKALKGLRIATRALSLGIWVFIGLVVAGPVLGFLTLRTATGNIIGFGVDVAAIGPQLESALSR